MSILFQFKNISKTYLKTSVCVRVVVRHVADVIGVREDHSEGGSVVTGICCLSLGANGVM